MSVAMKNILKGITRENLTRTTSVINVEQRPLDCKSESLRIQNKTPINTDQGAENHEILTFRRYLRHWF